MAGTVSASHLGSGVQNKQCRDPPEPLLRRDWAAVRPRSSHGPRLQCRCRSDMFSNTFKIGIVSTLGFLVNNCMEGSEGFVKLFSGFVVYYLHWFGDYNT